MKSGEEVKKRKNEIYIISVQVRWRFFFFFKCSLRSNKLIWSIPVTSILRFIHSEELKVYQTLATQAQANETNN